MGNPEMGMGAPKQETPGHNREKIKRQIIEIIRKKLEEINIGSYTADKSYGGGHGEELFSEPENLDKILGEIGSKIDLCAAENWTEERLIQELSQIQLHFDFSRYRNYDDFYAFREEEELLDEFIDIEDIVAMLHNE